MHDKRNGFGKLTDSKGNIFEGNWINSFLDGEGKEILISGYRFEGIYKRGKKLEGKEILPDGEQYQGEFLNEKPHGYGQTKLPDGSIYEGQYLNGQFNGSGCFITPDGVKHIGMFKDGYLIQETSGIEYEFKYPL